MLLFTHIVIALASVAMSTVALFLPSRSKLNISNGLVAGTLASGTYLVISTRSPLISACTTGLTYLAVVMALLYGARRRLAHQEIINKD